jgi:NtrC-family two-component system response regulator AlgB
VERAFILATGDFIELGDLPEKLSKASNGSMETRLQVGTKVSIEELESEHIRQVIRQASTMEEAAHILGIDPATLYRKRKKLAL